MNNDYFDFLNQNAKSEHPANTASSNDGYVNLTTRADAECQVVCDGDFLFLLNPNQITKEKAPVGQHILQFISTEYPDLIVEKIVDFPEVGKNYLVMVNEFKRIIEDRVNKETEAKNQESLAEKTVIMQKNGISIVREVPSYGNYRTNADGRKFFLCRFSVLSNGREYQLNEGYSFAEGLDVFDMGPAIAISGNTIIVFVSEKDEGVNYDMNGTIYIIEGSSIEKHSVFRHHNYGWFPYFCIEDGDLCFRNYSFNGRVQFVSYLNLDLFQPDPDPLGSISPDECKRRQLAAGPIFFYG